MKDFGVGKILLALALLGSVSVQAEEAYEVNWVQHFETDDTWDTGLSIATDSNDNMIVASINGNNESFINKFNNDGTLLWSKKILNPNYSLDYYYGGMTIDKNNNIFITGKYNNSGNRDGFVAKYDSDGTLIWDQQFGTPEIEYINDVATDMNGNIFVTGSTGGTFNGEQNSGLLDAFILKYNNDGILIWNRQFGTSEQDQALDITTDSNGNIYVTGYAREALTGETFYGYLDVIVSKYSNNGELVWHRQFGTPQLEFGNAITIDNDDNILVAGKTFGTFDGEVGRGKDDAFILKYSNDGTLLWSNQFGTQYWDYVNSIATDSYGNIFVTGEVDGLYTTDSYTGITDGYVAKHNKNGNLLWFKQFDASDWDDANSITADKNNNIFITGYANGMIKGEVNNGTGSGYIMKLSSPNTAPVAVATATPQTVILNGTTVALNASQSYDPDADNISYKWGWIEKPLNSTAAFSNENSINPTFLADVKGIYTLYLDVTDTSDVTTRTEVIVVFNNIQPVADTGAYAPIVVGNSVNLDASASSDENGDTLTYSWSLVSKPAGSTTAIYNNQNVQAHLTADVEGTYEVSLIVNDGTVDSDPVNTTIEVITVQTATTDLIEQAIQELLAMPDSSFSNKNHRKTLINKLNVVVRMLASSEYQNAISKLENDILPKVDDYLNSAQTYETDWIISAGDQSKIYNLIAEAIGYLQNDINQ